MKQIDKILVIEDETDIRNTLKDVLEFEGYEVLLAANGKIGYNLITEYQPDLVICDVNMPELGGFELLESVNQNFKDKVIPPFLFMTAKVDKEDALYGMSLGADDYITKPFSTNHILKTIRLRLDKRKHLVEVTSLDRLIELNDELFSDGNEIDINGHIVMMNPSGLDMLSLTNESEIIGKDYIDYIHDCDKVRIDQLLKNAIGGCSTTFTFKSPKGKYFSSCFVPLLKGEQVEKIIGYSHDITEYKCV